METERMLRELRSVKSKEKDKQYHTFETDVYSMVSDVIPKIEKLGKLEDLEEQGRLIVLPCAIGDTIYEVFYVNKCDLCVANKKFGKCKYNGDNVECTKSRSHISEAKFNLNYYSIHTQSLVRNVYLTHEEAEKKLEEMKNVN